MENRNYVNNLKLMKIDTYEKALEYFNVRLKSFDQNYSKEFAMPACVLAELGFHFDKKSFKCHECSFVYDKIDQDNLNSIQHEHYKHRSTCGQVLKQLKIDLQSASSNVDATTNSVATSTSKGANLDDQHHHQNMDSMEIDITTSITTLNDTNKTQASKRVKQALFNKENRIRTFENAKLLFKPDELAAQGFYLVVNNQFEDPLEFSRETANSSQTTRTSIEQLAIQVPALLHLKCAYCPYECLIFKNSLQNTFFKSPIDEHFQKSAKICPIFNPDRLR